MYLSRKALALTLVGWLAAGTGIAQPTQKVTLGLVTTRELPRSIRLVATVRPERTSVIASEFSGRVAALHVDDGQPVQKGDTLLTLDNAARELRLREAQAQLASLQAELAERENGTRSEVLNQLNAAVGEAEALHDMWVFERTRVRELFERNQSSAKERNDAEMEFQAAERRLSQARARLEAAQNGPRKEEIERFRQSVAAQQAVVTRLEREVALGTIRAPFSGYVTARYAEVGQWLTAGGPVVDLVALDTVRVRCEVPEDAIRFARPGAVASIEITALGETLPGTVSRMIPQAVANARTFPVEIDLPNPEQKLLPGMFAWAQVPAGDTEPRMLVDKDAVVPRGQQKHVFMVVPGERGHMAMPIAVETGLEADGKIEVRSGQLRPGAAVVIRANERLMPFMPNAVEPLNPEVLGTPPARQE